MLCRLGGSKQGIEEEVRAGDVMVIPAGVAHERYVQDPETLSHSMLYSHTWLNACNEKRVNGMSLYIDPLFAQTLVQKFTEDKSALQRCMHARHYAAQRAAVSNVAH